jgi:hypothetical protein
VATRGGLQSTSLSCTIVLQEHDIPQLELRHVSASGPTHQDRLTLAEAARLTGHSAVSLRQAVRLGRLKAKRVGEANRSTLYVTRADLDAYLHARRTWRTYHGEQHAKENEA